MNPYSKLTSDVASTDLIVRLPDLYFTKSGIAFNPNETLWSWVDGTFRVYLDFCSIACSPEIRASLQQTLTVFAKGSSARHFSNLFRAFKHFLSIRVDVTLLEKVTTEEVSNYGARLRQREHWRLGTLNVLLQKWGELGLEGVDPECLRYLRERRKPGNPKGDAVRTRDPVEGPFSESEYTSLYKAVDGAYGVGGIPQWVAVLARLHFVAGGRITQFASMKVKDVVVNGSDVSIRLPQAKTQEAHSRISFNSFDLSPQTGRLVLEYVHKIKLIGADETALFSEIEVKGFDSRSRAEEDIFFGHCTSNDLSRVFSAQLRKISPPSDRLNFEPLPITSKRWRSTLGTRLAEEGASKAVIGKVLGHTDLQNVGVYFEGSPKIIESIDKALNSQLAPLAKAFKGRLVEDEGLSTHRGAPGSRIIDFRVSENPVGSCGSKGQGCGFNKPVACYTCFKFEPWLDAPHEKVLQRLKNEREKFSGNNRILMVNDDAIRAVEQVIAECSQIREK